MLVGLIIVLVAFLGIWILWRYSRPVSNIAQDVMSNDEWFEAAFLREPDDEDDGGMGDAGIQMTVEHDCSIGHV